MPMVITRGAASAKGFGWSGKTGVVGQQAYTTPGTYSWVAPAGVTKVSLLAVGPGAGGGGALAYRNNQTVIPGSSFTMIVAPGVAANATASFSLASSRCFDAKAGGGSSSSPGSPIAGTGYYGGSGNSCGGGGGGAAGYSGNGGTYNCAAPAGGGGGGGSSSQTSNFPSCCIYNGYGGGGVGILGQGASGGISTGGSGGAGGGGGNGGNGGLYGGGAGTYSRYFNWSGGPCCVYQCRTLLYGTGAGGAVRIIWPGCARSFPSTRTADE